MFGKQVVEILQLIALLIMVAAAMSVVLVPRLTERDGMRRAIQFLAVVLVVPAILILALGQVLMPETVGTLMGAVMGYLLSGIGAETPNA